MKAIVLTRYGSPDNLQFAEVETPVPKDGEVLVRVEAASVNDWDWCLVRGKPFYIRLFCGLFKPKVRIPGVDIAGRVVAIGRGTGEFQIGDSVYGDLSECGFGGFAEYVCAPVTALALKPENMTWTEAASIPHAAMLALQGLRELGKLQPGQKLLINGAGGGVGTLGLQIARAIGVAEVTGVDSSSKAEMMRRIGFDQTIDYREDDFTDLGDCYDLILDPKTDRSVFRYLRALNPKGSYVTVGGLTGRLLQIFSLSSLVRRITGKQVRILALKPNQGLDYINELFEAGKLKPVIDGPFELADAVDALKRFGAGKHIGKVVVTVNSGDG